MQIKIVNFIQNKHLVFHPYSQIQRFQWVKSHKEVQHRPTQGSHHLCIESLLWPQDAPTHHIQLVAHKLMLLTMEEYNEVISVQQEKYKLQNKFLPFSQKLTSYKD